MLIWSIAVFLLSTAWWVIHSERARNRLRSRVGRVDAVSANRTVALAIAIVAVVVAAGSAIQVYRIGDSGAKAVWHDQTD